MAGREEMRENETMCNVQCAMYLGRVGEVEDIASFIISMRKGRRWTLRLGRTRALLVGFELRIDGHGARLYRILI